MDVRLGEGDEALNSLPDAGSDGSDDQADHTSLAVPSTTGTENATDADTDQSPVAEAGVETLEGEVTPALPEPQVSELVSRIDELTAAIEHFPEAPVNYVLRGEALMEGGEYDQAAEDFTKALELAEMQAESANWGYILRALADRAREGLRQM